MKNSSLIGNKDIHTPTTSYSAPHATPAPITLPRLYNTELKSGDKRTPGELIFLIVPLAMFCIAAINICKRHFRSNRNGAGMNNRTDDNVRSNGLSALQAVVRAPLSASSSFSSYINLGEFELSALPTNSPQNSHSSSSSSPTNLEQFELSALSTNSHSH